MAMSDELENSGKLVVRPEQVGSMEDSHGARVDSNKLDKAVSKKSDVQEEEVTTGGFRESNGDRESMRAPDTTESGTARGENADPFETIKAHDHHQFEEKEFKAKITCGNRLIGYRKYKVFSFDMNSIKRNEVTSGGTECVGLDWLDGLDSAHNGYFPQNGNSSQLNKSRPLFRLFAAKDGHAAFEETQPVLPTQGPGFVSHDNGGFVNQQRDSFPGLEVVSPIKKGLHEKNVDQLEKLDCQLESTGEHDQSQTDDVGLFDEKKAFSEGVFKAKITCGDRLIGYRKYKVLSFDTNSIKGNEVTSGGTECIGLDGLDSAHKGYFPQNGNSTANLPTKDNTVSDQTGPPIAALELSVKDESARESKSPVAVGDGSSSSQDGNASFNVCCGVWDWLRGERG